MQDHLAGAKALMAACENADSAEERARLEAGAGDFRDLTWLKMLQVPRQLEFAQIAQHALDMIAPTTGEPGQHQCDLMNGAVLAKGAPEAGFEHVIALLGLPQFEALLRVIHSGPELLNIFDNIRFTARGFTDDMRLIVATFSRYNPNPQSQPEPQPPSAFEIMLERIKSLMDAYAELESLLLETQAVWRNYGEAAAKAYLKGQRYKVSPALIALIRDNADVRNLVEDRVHDFTAAFAELLTRTHELNQLAKLAPASIADQLLAW
ncbi:MAG TPA: hypothetical protein VFO38_06600 [Candidatus Saccharimonadales bacterium]|nr:hypothetical protein [Candidatus Saccharimonadales bacterium]